MRTRSGRPDADLSRIGRLVRTRRPGNIYRAEILYRGGVPSTPGSALSREAFDRVCDSSVITLLEEATDELATGGARFHTQSKERR